MHMQCTKSTRKLHFYYKWLDILEAFVKRSCLTKFDVNVVVMTISCRQDRKWHHWYCFYFTFFLIAHCIHIDVCAHRNFYVKHLYQAQFYAWTKLHANRPDTVSVAALMLNTAHAAAPCHG